MHSAMTRLGGPRNDSVTGDSVLVDSSRRAMSSSSSQRPWAGFLGTWVLIPESCNHEQGLPPRAGRYVISEAEGRLTFTLDWVDATGASHQVTFSGIPDGEPARFAGGELADALAVSAPSSRRLDSVAFRGGQALMFAERQLDDGGTMMRVVQQVRLPDGSRPTNVSLYRKHLPN